MVSDPEMLHGGILVIRMGEKIEIWALQLAGMPLESDWLGSKYFGFLAHKATHDPPTRAVNWVQAGLAGTGLFHRMPTFQWYWTRESTCTC